MDSAISQIPKEIRIMIDKETRRGILRQAKALLAEGPHRWIKGSFAKTGWKTTEPDSSYANCWCMDGAIRKFNRGSGVAVLFGDTCAAAELQGEVWNFNDSYDTTYGMVLQKFDELIAIEELPE